MNAMDANPYKDDSFYIFDRWCNDFERMFRINTIGAYFVIKGKKVKTSNPLSGRGVFLLVQASYPMQSGT